MAMERRSAGEHVPVPGGQSGGTGPYRPLRLCVERGPDAGRSFVVGQVGATLGRADDNTFVLTDPAISRRHAQVEAQEAGLTIADAGSRHGTWVNGRRLDRPCPLRPGDTVGLGNSTLRVEPVFDSAALAARGAPAPAETGAATPASAPGTGVYRTPEHERGASREPVYELREGRLYRTAWHERGPGHQPDYELRGGALYRTVHHEQGTSAAPDYLAHGGAFYRTRWHPRGASATPDYRLGAPGAPVTTWGASEGSPPGR